MWSVWREEATSYGVSLRDRKKDTGTKSHQGKGGEGEEVQ